MKLNKTLLIPCLSGLLLAGCGSHNPPVPPPTPTNQIADIQKQLDEANAAKTKAENELKDAKKELRESYEKFQALAKAQDTAMANMTNTVWHMLEVQQESFLKLLQASEEQRKTAGGATEPATNPPPVITATFKPDSPPPLPPPLDGPGGADTNPPVPPDQNPNKTSSDSNDETLKQGLVALGAVLCVAQPEVCPFVAAFASFFGGSTVEATETLGAVTALAQGKALTPDQRKALLNSIKNKADKVDPGAFPILETLLNKSSDPDIQKAWKEAKNNIIDKLGAGAAAIKIYLSDRAKSTNPDDLKQLLDQLVTAGKTLQGPALDEFKRAAGLQLAPADLDKLLTALAK